MFYKSMFFKQSVLFLSIFAISGGTTVFMMYKNSSHDNEIVQPEDPIAPTPGVMTPSEKLLNSVMNYKLINVDAEFNATQPSPLLEANFSFKGDVDMSDLEALKVSGKLDVNANGSNVKADLAYYSDKDGETNQVASTMYLDYNETHLKLDQANLMSFIDMLPSVGGIELPPELKEIDFAQIASDITKMEPEKDATADVDGKYIFKLPTILEGMDVYFKSDKDFNFEGIKTNIFRYQGFNMKLNINVNEAGPDAVIINPAEGVNKEKYQDFTPALNLITGLENVFAGKQNTIGLGVNVTTGQGDAQTTIGLDTDISYDMNSGAVSLAANIKENAREHKFKMALDQGKLFLNQEDINKVTFKGITLTSLMDYLNAQVDNGTIKEILDHISSLVNNVKVTNVLNSIKDFLYPGQKVETEPAPQAEPSGDKTMDTILSMLDQIQSLNNWIKHIDIIEGKTTVTLDLTQFGIQADNIQIILSGNEEKFEGIQIAGLNINGTIIDINLAPKAYDLFSVTEDEEKSYVALDPAVTLMPSILDIAKSKELFRFNIQGLVDDKTIANKDTNINGGFQFDIRKGFGYGDVTILDGNAQEHRLRADLGETKDLLITYNEKLKGHMAAANLLEMGKSIGTILMGKDAGFNAAFGSLLTNLQNTPIFKAINGDIGAAFINDAFVIKEVAVDDSIAITDPDELRPLKYIAFSVSGKLFGMDDTSVDIKIVCPKGEIKSIDIEDMKMDANTSISMSLSVADYDKALDDTRLRLFDDYIDLNDLKVLLDLGIKTVSFEYYHVKGLIDINFNLGIIPIPVKDMVLDFQIRNQNGKITAIASFPQVPVDLPSVPGYGKIFTNPDFNTTRSRSLVFMYRDGMVYGDRIDNVNDPWLQNRRNVRYTFAAKEDHFVKNLSWYMTDFAFGLNEKLLNEINSGSSGSSAPIRYENLINSFVFVDGTNKGTYSEFNISVNLEELTKNKNIAQAGLNLYSDNNRKYIERIGVDLAISLPLGLSVGIHVDLSMQGENTPIDFTRIDNFIKEFAQQQICEGDNAYLHVNDELRGYHMETTSFAKPQANA